MSDGERKQVIALLTNMYSQQDTSVALSHIPHEINDTADEEFQRYFDFLQTLYLLQSDFMNMDPEEIEARLTQLKLDAYHFNYPQQQLEAFDVA